MIPVTYRKQKTLLPLIKKWIKPGSIIHSDCWKAYCNLNKMGYTHVTVNHSKEFKNESNAACTNCIESEWQHAKVYMPNYRVHKGLHGRFRTNHIFPLITYTLFLSCLPHLHCCFDQRCCQWCYSFLRNS